MSAAAAKLHTEPMDAPLNYVPLFPVILKKSETQGAESLNPGPNAAEPPALLMPRLDPGEGLGVTPDGLALGMPTRPAWKVGEV